MFHNKLSIKFFKKVGLFVTKEDTKNLFLEDKLNLLLEKFGMWRTSFRYWMMQK
jgi:hypothetical protein